MKHILHRHSTLFGFLCALAVCAAAGWETHWNAAALGAGFLVPLFFLPRLFYGLKDARELDAYQPPPSKGYPDLGYGTQGFWSDTDAEENAYLESRLAGYNPDGTESDPDALRKLAEQEEPR